MQKALGILETYGLLCAVATADTMVKAANVELIGYELARGQGMALVKIEGDVGAVKAALASGEAQAKEMGLFRGKDLIPRPAENLDMMVYNDLTVGYGEKATDGGSEPPQAEPAEKAEAKPAEKPEAKPEKPEKAEAKPAEKPAEPEAKPEVKKPTCNLCGDPRCPRKFGEPHKLCIHYGEK